MQILKSITPGFIMIIVSVVVLSQAFSMEKQTITDPAGGSFFPALIAIIMLLSGIITSIKGAQQLRTFSHSSNEDLDETEVNEKFTWEDFKLIFIFFILIVIYVLLIPLIHFYPATFLFLLISMLFLKGVSWKLNLLVSIISLLVIYLLFSGLFGIIFP